MKKQQKQGQVRAKAGTSKAAAAARKVAFAHAYITNGKNGKQAAIAAGFSPRSAETRASELVRDRDVAAIIAEATKRAAAESGLTVERTLREVARLAYADPRKLYDEDGNLIPIHLLDDDTAATIASVEVVEMAGGAKVGGDAGVEHVVMHTKKVKTWDKNAALEKAMKYHGLYEADNKQKPPMLPPVLNIVAVSVRK